jgi:hypothetical protein
MSRAADRLHRLAGMSASELAYRGRELGRRAADRARVATIPPRWRRARLADVLVPGSPSLTAARDRIRRGAWSDAHVLLSQHFLDRAPRFLVHASGRSALVSSVRSGFPGAVADASERARRISSGGYDLLGYSGLRFGAAAAPDWHLDPVSGRRAPADCWTTIQYLDPRHGDHKVIWELNRHQHWLALGRAEWLIGDGAARETFLRELASWLSANPPLCGINWASALELALRAISWTWALELFVAAPAHHEAPWTVDLLLALDRQLAQVDRHLSRYFSPNTHLLGEALALYVCGSAIPELRGSAERAARGREVLLQETVRQVLPDGGHAERSPHYHRYALEFYLLALSVARVSGDRALVEALAPVAHRMAVFLHHFCDDAGRYPLIGDDDGGELCPITGHNHGHARQTLGWAAELLEAPALAIGPRLEAVSWLTALTDGQANDRGRRPQADAPGVLRTSIVFEDTGYVVARHGGSQATIDVGAHGFFNGGHAHADALGVTITARGAPLVIDPGTATYTMDRALRDRLRSSQWHNTLSLDGRSQSQPAGPFAWATAASARIRHVRINPRFDYVDTETDAWHPIVHRRIFFMAGDDYWVIADRIMGDGRHRADMHWHLDPLWQVEAAGPSAVRLTHSFNGAARVAVPDARLDVFHADRASGLGWCAPVYGRLEPTSTVRAHVEDAAPFWVVTTIDATGSQNDATTFRLEVLAVGDAGDPVAICTRRGDVADVTMCRAEPSREMITTAMDSRHERAITTDARLVHARVLEPGRIDRLYLADLTVFRFDGTESLTLTTGSPIADLAVTLPRGGEPVLESSVDGIDVSLCLTARGRRETEPLRVRTRRDQPTNRTGPSCAV